MILTAAAVKPEVVDLSLVCKKLADLIDVVVVVLLVVHLNAAELRGGVVEADVHIVLAAGINKLTYKVALAVAPRGRSNGIICEF